MDGCAAFTRHGMCWATAIAQRSLVLQCDLRITARHDVCLQLPGTSQDQAGTLAGTCQTLQASRRAGSLGKHKLACFFFTTCSLVPYYLFSALAACLFAHPAILQGNPASWLNSACHTACKRWDAQHSRALFCALAQLLAEKSQSLQRHSAALTACLHCLPASRLSLNFATQQGHFLHLNAARRQACLKL